MDQQVVSLSNINPSLPSGSFAPIDECYFDQNSTLAPQKNSFDGSCEYGQAKYIEYIDEVWWSMDNKRAEHEECVSISWIDP